jgi:ribonucleoside-diphosphate reductase alpha chain
MYGTTHKVRTGYGTIFVTVNRDKPNGIPQEVFVATNHAGSELRAWSEFASRISSMALRHGMPPEILIKCGRHIRGAKPILDGGKTVYSGPDAVAQVLEQELAIKAEDSKDDMCPECHNGMVREEGCLKCPSCSYSQCGG